MTSQISLQTTIDIAAIVNQQQRDANAPGTPANRHDLAAALKASYEAQGRTDVTPEMIERAISTYYEERLQFKGVQGGLVTRFAAATYLQFFAHRKLLVGVLAGAVIVGFSLNPIKEGMRNAAFKSVASEFAALEKDMARINGKAPRDLVNHEEWLVQATAKSTQISKPAYDSLLGSYNAELKVARESLMDLNKQVGKVIPHPTVAEVSVDVDGYREQSQSLKDSMERLQAGFNDRIRALDAIQNKVAELVAVEKAYLNALTGPGVQETLSDPDVFASKANAEKYLAAGDANAARAEVSTLNKLVATKAKHHAIVAKGTALTDKYAGAFHYPESKEFAEALFTQVKYAVSKDDEAGLAQIAKQYQALKAQEAQAAMALTIRVVNRPGEISGMGRKFNDTGNKRFFLILEAVDKAGMPQQRLIYNHETGKTEAVSFWAQEVEEATLRKVAADKKADGVIDDNVFGHKPAGTYSPIFDRKVLKGTLTSWPEA